MSPTRLYSANDQKYAQKQKCVDERLWSLFGKYTNSWKTDEIDGSYLVSYKKDEAIHQCLEYSGSELFFMYIKNVFRGWKLEL